MESVKLDHHQNHSLRYKHHDLYHQTCLYSYLLCVPRLTFQVFPVLYLQCPICNNLPSIVTHLI
jgi:hypothetical protein